VILRRRHRTAAVGGVALALLLGPLPLAVAEGPGYGGDAGQLSVTWEASASDTAPVGGTQPAAASALAIGGGARGVATVVMIAPAGDPQLQNDALALMVRGLGFRGKSEIEVRIGSDQPVKTRANSAGALSVALDPSKLGRAQPGVSVMAVGRNQSGTEVTLFGSIPPVADGSGPMSLVPWGAAAITVAGLALWMRRRHALHDDGQQEPAASR
jgi:hypothetical protein